MCIYMLSSILSAPKVTLDLLNGVSLGWVGFQDFLKQRYSSRVGEMHVNITTYIHACSYMWQSRVEIEDYSVAYFNRIAVFKVPYC